MYKQTRKFLLASSIATALAAASGSVAAQADDAISSARQESQISTTYALSPYLRANDLEVAVVDGTATLTGIVEEDVSKDLAEQIALGVPGIEDVDNKIEVKADFVAAERIGERTFGEVVDDASITAAIKSKLLWSRYSDGLATNVDTVNGNVTLTGTADNGAAKELAENLAMNTYGVHSVENELVIAERSSDAEGNAVVAASDEDVPQMSDTWITTKVKATLMFSRNVSGSDISVSTEDGIVTLTGKVDSGAERALAVELAQNIRGVAEVDADDLELLTDNLVSQN